jgi:hypothetical protein
MRINMGQKNPGSINPALNRESEFTVPGNEGLAGTAIPAFDFIRCQPPDARGRTCRAGTVQEDDFALVAFPFSPAYTFKGDPGTPYCFEHG